MSTDTFLKVPFQTFVIKIVSRCNLNCSYCYMYNLQDSTYKGQPKRMSQNVTQQLGQKINNHSIIHNLEYVHIILHGGEPLLMGKQFFVDWINKMKHYITYATPIFSVQSNGTLIDEEWISLLYDNEVGIGISIDGPKEYHDEYRVDHNKKGSFDEVVKAIRLLQKHPKGPHIFSTVMAVVNTNISPSKMIELWDYLQVEGFDLSLPHSNYEFPPPVGKLSYTEWLIQFFDLWFEKNQPNKHVRYFENIIRMLFNYPQSTDNIGGKPVDVIVVETDGGIEPTDAFKCCEDGMTKLNLNVCENEFDDLYEIPMVNVLQSGSVMLCSTCKQCELLNVCGGGYMPHRYKKDNLFDNPSVYCPDLYSLIHHIRSRVFESLPSSITNQLIGI